jgi:polyisoprenoid-binding protein YceI
MRLVVALVFLAPSVCAQLRFATEQGVISLTSNAPLEIIKANSNKVSGHIDPSTNQFAFLVPISSFTGFNSDLQRQHFNENYMESSKYARASFTGKIIEGIDFEKDSVYQVRAKGDLDVHGQKQTRIIKSKVTISKGAVRIEADFTVPLTDHNIAIPKIVSQKIATEIEVIFRAVLLKKE